MSQYLDGGEPLTRLTSARSQPLSATRTVTQYTDNGSTDAVPMSRSRTVTRTLPQEPTQPSPSRTRTVTRSMPRQETYIDDVEPMTATRTITRYEEEEPRAPVSRSRVVEREVIEQPRTIEREVIEISPICLTLPKDALLLTDSQILSKMEDLARLGVSEQNVVVFYAETFQLNCLAILFQSIETIERFALSYGLPMIQWNYPRMINYYQVIQQINQKSYYGGNVAVANISSGNPYYGKLVYCIILFEGRHFVACALTP